MRVRVIGIGTPHGDDALGLAVAERLEGEGPPPGVSVHACARPVPDLVDLLAGAEAAVLVDATRCGLPAGAVHEPPPAALGRAPRGSSHGLGVREALELAAALGHRPRVRVVGVEVARAEGDGLSDAVREALPEALGRVRALCRELLAEEARGSRPDASREARLRA